MRLLWRLGPGTLAITALLLLFAARWHRNDPGTAALEPAVRFVEISEQAGIHFIHNNGATGKKYMPETIGSGVAFLDYDNDGWQDLLFINSTNWPGDKSRHSTLKLYRNNGDGTFTDVTRQAGLDIEMYGMGVAVGDYDNDGYEDIYITGIGPNHLFRNTLGDPGRKPGQPIFQEVTQQAGVEGVPPPGMPLRWKWSTSAAWLDYDKDGKLDLFVCNYVKWSPKTDIRCGRPDGSKQYCPPESYEGVCCTLYHNEGGGRFRDVSAETGIRSLKTAGKSFGIAVADYNGDGWPDIAVANDTWPNFLFVNQGGKRFVEKGIESGLAEEEGGKAKAGMGIDTADWNNDGKFGLTVGNFTAEGLSLFRNDSTGSDILFTNVSSQDAIAATSLNYLTFGCLFFDYDLDGRQDLLAANGHIDDLVHLSNTMISYRERPLLYRNLGQGRFEEVGLQAGLRQQVVGRGLAYGDIDNDGDLDVALIDNGGRARLFRNEGGNRHRWIRFRTVGSRSNREGIGALIRVTVGAVTQSQYVHSGGSFLSECQREPTFGLGSAMQADRIEIMWPSGAVDRIGPLAANHQYLVNEGQGAVIDPRFKPGRE